MSSSKKPEKSPFGGHSVQDVAKAEEGSYYIQIGSSMFESESGKLAFSKERANTIYMNIWEDLDHMKENGTPQEQEDARQCLLHFRIIPLRFH